MPLFVLLLPSAVLVLGGRGRAADAPAPAFETPVAADNLDPETFTQAVGADETAVALKDGPRHVLWTRDTPPEWDGVYFGESKDAGPRHLRIGFKAAIPVGAVLTARRRRAERAEAGGGLPRQTRRRRRLDPGRAAEGRPGWPRGSRRGRVRRLGAAAGDRDARPALHAHRRRVRPELSRLARRRLRAGPARGERRAAGGRLGRRGTRTPAASTTASTTERGARGTTAPTARRKSCRRGGPRG